MSDPVTLGIVFGALALGQGVMEKSATDRSNYKNELAAAERAAQVSVETKQATDKQNRENYLRSGKAVAAAAANSGGVTGSAIDILGDSAAQNAQDLLTIKQTGMAQKNAIITEAKNATKANQKSWLSIGTSTLMAGLSGYAAGSQLQSMAKAADAAKLADAAKFANGPIP